MMRKTLIAGLGAALLASAACFNFTSTMTSPSGAGGASTSLLGGWSSVAPSTAANSCTNIQRTVKQTSGNTATGTFAATCFGNVQVSGSASGTLAGATVTWTASATAVIPNLATCPIALAGTATLVGDTIQIPYSGTTCLGPVSGTETIKKR
jgi:hypothetical protein